MSVPLSGILNLNKPSGVTSRKVVDVVQRLVRPAKSGHAGTLDPLADGVLVVCVGQATRLIEFIQRMPKTYLGTFLLGRRSDTEDVEGRVEELTDPPAPTREQLEAAALKFTGEILQRPPVYSALKIAGRRAYELARKGMSVELTPRPVTVHRLEIRSYRYPELEMEIECSRGTYVRSLGRDLAESLGTAAVMSALTRTAVGGFRLGDALPPDRLRADNLPQCLLSMIRAVDDLPQCRVDEEELALLRQGRPIGRKTAEPSAAEIAALDPHGDLAAILKPAGERQLRPATNFGA
ncbi:MAG: tRNA pseudouridine(55) synthase TruB [Pirellulales bacterium]|nr:tRNA pseudouridine(55) synthase TruB [Pirellulales bacterium]